MLKIFYIIISNRGCRNLCDAIFITIVTYTHSEHIRESNNYRIKFNVLQPPTYLSATHDQVALHETLPLLLNYRSLKRFIYYFEISLLTTGFCQFSFSIFLS